MKKRVKRRFVKILFNERREEPKNEEAIKCNVFPSLQNDLQNFLDGKKIISNSTKQFLKKN